MSLPPQSAPSTASRLGHPGSESTHGPTSLFNENQNLKEQLRHLHDALDTAYTPGHDALRVRCEDAEANIKIITADISAAKAYGATTRAEALVIKARLEDETVAKDNAQRLLNEKKREVEELKKKMKGLQQHERASQKKIGNFENVLKQTKEKITESQQMAVGMKEKIKEMEAEMKTSAAKEKKLESKVERTERVAVAARAACKTMEDRLKGERTNAREREKKLHNRVEAELALVKRIEGECNEWKHKARMTARRLRIEEERNTRLEEVHRTFTLPPAPSLLDGNNDVLLSPAPLAELKNTEVKSPDSESRSRFTSLPFATDEESTEGAWPSEQSKKRSKLEKDSQSVNTRKRKSADVPNSFAAEEGTRRSPRFGNKTLNTRDEQATRMRKEVGRAKSAEQHGTSEAAGQPSPSKRRRVESERSKKDVSITEKAGGPQTRQSAMKKSEIDQRNTGGRVLRSQRRVSYDYNQAGRDIMTTAPGAEVDNRLMGRKRVRQMKKPSKRGKA